jgi:hypothetical protein
MQDLTVRGEVGTLASMQFIDFEYGGYAYRGHDWGNHFAEYAGFECEYSRYPDNEHVEMFVRAYLNEGAHSPAVRSIPPSQPAHCMALQRMTLPVVHSKRYMVVTPSSQRLLASQIWCQGL